MRAVYNQEEMTAQERRSVPNDVRHQQYHNDFRQDGWRPAQQRTSPFGYKARDVAMGRDAAMGIDGPRPNRKGDSKPLTERQREEKMNSWNI